MYNIKCINKGKDLPITIEYDFITDFADSADFFSFKHNYLFNLQNLRENK